MVPPSPVTVSWVTRIARAFSLTLIVLSATAVVGWWADIDPFIRWFPRMPAIGPGAAIGFLILGFALLARDLGARSLGYVALAALIPTVVPALGNFILVQPFLSDWLGDSLLVEEGSLERIAFGPAVGFGFLIAAFSIAALARPNPARAHTFFAGLSGSLLASGGFTAITGYLLGLPSVYRLGGDAPVPAATAVLLMLLGVTLVLFAWREHQQHRPGIPSWIAVPILVASTSCTLIFWTGLREREQLFIDASTQTAINSFAEALRNEFSRLAYATERLARHWSPRAPADETQREAHIRELMLEVPALHAVALADTEAHTVWRSVQRTRDVFATGPAFDNDRRSAAERARPANAPASIAFSTEPDGGLVVLASRYDGDRFLGYAVLELTFRRFFEALEDELRLAPHWHLNVSLDGQTVYQHGSRDAVDDTHRQESVFTFSGQRFRISMQPTATGFENGRLHLPEFVLAAGLGITLLLALSVHLARSARSSLNNARQANQRLVAENEQRRQVEEKLRLADERLNLAIEAARMGVGEWNPITNELHLSPGFWQILGYARDQIPTNTDAWLRLLHPEHLPAYHTTLEQLRSHDTTELDHEFRVAAADGSWRWLHLRAKVIARTQSGDPSRIVGTFQDVTERKAADEALRISQANTRKLSLVAAYTDNLVIIARPDGMIDWVNQSFERTLEHRLADIVGRDPATFLSGPETNPRTLRRIHAARLRGEPLSTDVTCYSKSGRKFHLHLEVQPVRNESGQLENFIAVLANITSRVETEHNLRRAKVAADTASRAKSEFLASMSHEIRTPMNGVIGMTNLLLDTKLDAEQRDYVNIIRGSGEALLSIINDILDFSKIESGKMELERLPFELSACLEDVLDLLSVPAATKKLDLAYHIENDVPAWIQGDVTRLRQVLVNLVNNAVKFTPSGGISITVRRLPVSTNTPTPPSHFTLEFSVTDTGIGIPADRLHRLFRPFSQVDSSTTRKFGGTGLGLAICHRLCTLMGGSIHVASTPGEGSTFTFTIQTETASVPPDWSIPEMPAALHYGPLLCLGKNPTALKRLGSFLGSWGAQPVCVDNASQANELLNASVAPVAAVIDHALVSTPAFHAFRDRLASTEIPIVLLVQPGLDPRELAAFTSRLGTTTATLPLRTQSLIRALQSLFGSTPESISPFIPASSERLLAHELPLNILLAEDNPVNQKVALRYLERLGYRADVAGNGIEVLNTLEHRSYDLVLMDMQMPEMDGIEAARQIRRRLPSSRQPRIIALTANALQGDREQCFAAGMDDYISKPVKLHEIVDAIRRQFTPPPPTA